MQLNVLDNSNICVLFVRDISYSSRYSKNCAVFYFSMTCVRHNTVYHLLNFLSFGSQFFFRRRDISIHK